MGWRAPRSSPHIPSRSPFDRPSQEHPQPSRAAGMAPPQFGPPSAVPPSDAPVLELVTMLATSAPAKLGGQLMKALAEAAPLRQRLQHVKRVRKAAAGQLEILLCPLDWRQGQQGNDSDMGNGRAAAPAGQQGAPAAAQAAEGAAGGEPDLPPEVAAIVRQHGLQTFVAQVSQHAPQTKEQLAEWGAHWPLLWRPPDANSQPHLAELSAAEVACMRRHMATAWQLAQHNGASGGVANACVLVDPSTDRVVAAVADCSHQHPLRHAAMAAVAAAAEWQRRVWPDEQREHYRRPRHQQVEGGSDGSEAEMQQAAAEVPAAAAGVSVEAAAGAAGEGPAAAANQDREAGGVPSPAAELDGKRRRLEGSHDVQDAAHEAAPGGEAGAAAGSSGGGGGEGQDEALPHPHKQHGASTSLAAGAAAAGAPAAGSAPQQPAAAAELRAPSTAADEAPTAAAEGPGPRPYMCTGYDCYLLAEPCTMCAMALVHSRLRRVVYCACNERWGALGGAYRLHAQRSLNHRYLVYRLPLAEEAEAAG